MKAIRVLGPGTYYIPRSPHAGLNASPMRGLFYLVKANRAEPGRNFLNHPNHPSGAGRQLSTFEAGTKYAAELMGFMGGKEFPRWAGGPLLLVPVPSSKTTATTMNTGNWPTLRLARELERLGVGTVFPAVVMKREMRSKLEGAEPRAEEFAENLHVVRQVPAGARVVYVDDLCTWGNHLAGIDAVLTPHQESMALVVAFTDSETLDAYMLRARIVSYDTTTSPWTVDVINTT